MGSDIIPPLFSYTPENGPSSLLEYMTQTIQVPITDPNPKAPPPPVKRIPPTKKPSVGNPKPEPLPN